MVAIIDSGDISGSLYRRSSLGQRPRYTVAWRYSEWNGTKAHLALLIDEDDHVRWLGRARGRDRVSSRDRRVEIVDIEEFSGLTLDMVRQQLSPRHREGLRLGLLPDAAGRAVVEVLVSMYPDDEALIRRLGRDDDLRMPVGERGRLLNEQRDGTGLLLEIGGVGRESLRGWSPTDVQAPTFLAGIGPRAISEERIINHDISRFPQLVEGMSDHADWRVFGSDRRKMFVMNANVEPIETTLGVDVVYYNETFKSFVLIQYKRMVREESKSSSGRLWYRPDGNLQKELDRMEVVDQTYGEQSDDYRLRGKPCWVKLCEPYARVEDPTEFIRGMYLPRDYFAHLLEVSLGPRGGVRLGYDNVPRHLTNTTFAQLVKDGWIGTSGTRTFELETVVSQVLESRRSLVLGIPIASP